jgi:hypothetical protein
MVRESTNHCGPRLGQILPVVPAAAHAQQPPRAEPIRHPAQPAGRMTVRRRRIAQMGNRITRQAVSTALKQNEFRPGGLDEVLYGFPGGEERRITGTGLKRNIQLGADSIRLPVFVRTAGTRLKKTAVLMHIRKGQIRIGFKRIKHTITMVRIDIDIGNPLQPISFA